MDLTVNVKMYPEDCGEGSVKELLFSGDRLAVLVENVGNDTLSVTAGMINDLADLNTFFRMMVEVTNGE